MTKIDELRLLHAHHPADAVSQKMFAEMIGRSEKAVQAMVENDKLPTVNWQNPQGTKASRRDRWIYLPAFNEGVRRAFETQPKEQRDAWLLWIGL